MKKVFFILFLQVFIFSCEKYPMPGSEILESFNYVIIGNYQSAEGGNYLETVIGVQIIIENLIPAPTTKFHVVFEVTKGGGTVEQSIIEADNSGKILTRWKLGTDDNQQEVKGQIFDASGQFYSEFKVNATAFFNNDWNTITTGYLTNIMDMVYDTVNHRSLMISGSSVYVRKTNFYTWEQQYYQSGMMLKDLEINSKKEVYGGGWDGKLYKTTDWGNTWNYVSTPIPGNQYHFELTISSDDYIWVNKWEYGIFCSKDGGLTWQNDISGLQNKEQTTPVYKFNESHLTLSLPYSSVLQTLDSGITWKLLTTPPFSNQMYVTDENEIIVLNQTNGITVHKSTDGGKTYRDVLNVDIAYRTVPMLHIFEKFGNDYYFIAPGGGVYKTRDYESFEEIISFTLQRHLFIDHTGTIYATDFFGEPALILPGQH